MKRAAACRVCPTRELSLVRVFVRAVVAEMGKKRWGSGEKVIFVEKGEKLWGKKLYHPKATRLHGRAPFPRGGAWDASRIAKPGPPGAAGGLPATICFACRRYARRHRGMRAGLGEARFKLRCQPQRRRRRRCWWLHSICRKLLDARRLACGSDAISGGPGCQVRCWTKDEPRQVQGRLDGGRLGEDFAVAAGVAHQGRHPSLCSPVLLPGQM